MGNDLSCIFVSLYIKANMRHSTSDGAVKGNVRIYNISVFPESVIRGGYPASVHHSPLPQPIYRAVTLYPLRTAGDVSWDTDGKQIPMWMKQLL